VSTPPNISSGGVFLGSRFTYVNDGGDGGKGGKGAVGGGRGKKGIKGKKTQHCDEASDGQDGERGLPDSSLQAVDGPGGPGGAGVSPAFEPVRQGTCADQIPFPPMSIASVTPNSGAQGTTVRVTIAGIGFDPAAAGFTVEVSGFGVSTARVASPPAPAHTSSLTTWDLTIANLAPKTARDVTVKNTLANKADLVGGFTVT